MLELNSATISQIYQITSEGINSSQKTCSTWGISSNWPSACVACPCPQNICRTQGWSLVWKGGKKGFERRSTLPAWLIPHCLAGALPSNGFSAQPTSWPFLLPTKPKSSCPSPQGWLWRGQASSSSFPSFLSTLGPSAPSSCPRSNSKPIMGQYAAQVLWGICFGHDGTGPRQASFFHHHIVILWFFILINSKNKHVSQSWNVNIFQRVNMSCHAFD